MARMPNGISIRGNSIQLSFPLHGVQCRETIRCGGSPTKAHIEQIKNKRQSILYEISIGTFDYSQHFPNSNSKIAKQFRKNGKSVSVKDAILEWFKRIEKKCAASTVKDYISIIDHSLIPEFGAYKLDELRPGDVKNWMVKLQETISNKRINNILIPLRQAFREAYEDEIIESNPLSRVRNLPIHTREPKPFNQKEITKILSQLDGQNLNLIQFAFYSGLRTSELIGLKWEDVDLENNRIHVRRAIVRNKEKSTKTASGLRTVNLLPEAKAALIDQKQYTEQANEFVFHDSRSNIRWKSDQAIRKALWKPALKKAGVEYRCPYQTRHTYASMLLMQGKDPMYVAQQMGHKDWGSIRKNYGRWIPSQP